MRPLTDLSDPFRIKVILLVCLVAAVRISVNGSIVLQAIAGVMLSALTILALVRGLNHHDAPRNIRPPGPE